MDYNSFEHTTFDSLEQFEDDACFYILKVANESIEAKQSFNLVLCGGGTPKNIYAKLANIVTDWSKWHIFFGDERCLPFDHSERNSVMVEECLISKSSIPHKQVHFIEGELGNIAAANEYDSLLNAVEDFDLVLLGFGEDGHTASLFPGHEWDNSKNAVAVFDAPKTPSERVSLTPSRLSRTKNLLFLITGKNKVDAFKQWQTKNDLPVSDISALNEKKIYTFNVV